MLAGAVFYLAGLLLLANANGIVGVMLGAGVFIGIALACTASGMALAVGSRAVPTAVRSMVLGLITAAGSLGALLAAPIGQVLTVDFGWRAGVLGFLVLALGILPAAWFAGRVDNIVLQPGADQIGETSIKAAIGTALRTPPFIIMAGAYFVCGMQLLFITTHLPSYLAICGMDPMLSAEALGLISLFNVVGSLFFGWAGGRWSKLALNNCIPDDGDAEGNDEGHCGSKRHYGEMQGEQRHAKSGKCGNGVRQHSRRGRAADAPMQNEHDARVDDRERSKHAASRRTNLKA